MTTKKTDVLGYRIATEPQGSNPAAVDDDNEDAAAAGHTAVDTADLLPLESCFPD